MQAAAGNVCLGRMAITGMRRTGTAVGIRFVAGNMPLIGDFGIMGNGQAYRHERQQHDKN